MIYSYNQVLVSNEVGGAGLNAIRLAEWLRSRAARIAVWTPGVGPITQKIRELGLAHACYAKSVYSPHWTRAAWGNLSLARRLRSSGGGIVHLHSPANYGATRFALWLSGLKRIVHLHLEEDAAGLRWAFRSPPDLIITCAKFLAEHARRALPADQATRVPIVVVPNSIRVDRFFADDKRQAKRAVGAPLDVPLILMLANLAPHKGQETAIRATARLQQRNVRVNCWLAGVERGGDAAYTARVRSLISELGVGDRVRLLGYRDDAPELLRATDFFLLPSTCEGLPLSILEAQATKVPVLAAPVSGVPEIVRDGDTGFLIAADDVDGYVRQIEILLANPALAARVTENAHAKTQCEHRWETYCERIWQVYQDLVGPRRNRTEQYECN